MPKPIWLRPITWRFACTKILSLEPARQRRLARRLGQTDLWSIVRQSGLSGRLLVELQILRHPRLLVDTVIELPDECEYLISAAAARQLAGHKRVELHRLYDGRAQSWTPKQIREAICWGPIFDQLDRLTPRGETGRPKV